MTDNNLDLNEDAVNALLRDTENQSSSTHTAPVTRVSTPASVSVTASQSAPEVNQQRDFFDNFQLFQAYFDNRINSLKSDLISEQDSRSKKIRDDVAIKFKEPGPYDLCHLCRQYGHWRKSCPLNFKNISSANPAINQPAGPGKQ